MWLDALQGQKLTGAAREALTSPLGLAAIDQQRAVSHHGLMATVIGEHPAAAAACRLAKRWAAGQMLSYKISGEALELMVAAVVSGCV
jgi:Nrap protein PAP/OAS1-like domain 5